MTKIKELWLSKSKRFRIVEAVYPDNSTDIQVELLGAWPKIGVPDWRTLSAHEIRQLPQYVQKKYIALIKNFKKD